jgi:hypothetical protein
MKVDITFPTNPPLHTDPRWQSATTRLDQLRERLATVERRQSGAIVDVDPVAVLLEDPAAPITPKADQAALVSETRALRGAVDAAERDLERVRWEISIEKHRALAPAKRERGRELVAVLGRAVQLIEADRAGNRQLEGAGYRADRPLAYPDDIDALSRLRTRVARVLAAWGEEEPR